MPFALAMPAIDWPTLATGLVLGAFLTVAATALILRKVVRFLVSGA